MLSRLGIAVTCSTHYHWPTRLTSKKTSRSSGPSEIRVMRYCCASHFRYASETDASVQPPGISKPTGRPSRTMSSGSVAERIRNRTRGAFFRKKAT